MHTVLASAYRQGVHAALAQQILTSLLALLVLDGGQFARLIAIALVAFWGAALCIIARRPMQPTKGDILFLRVAFLPIVLVVCGAAALRV